MADRSAVSMAGTTVECLAAYLAEQKVDCSEHRLVDLTAASLVEKMAAQKAYRLAENLDSY